VPVKRGKLRVAAVGDLHAHATHEGEFRSLFADLAGRADVLALCGDLTNVGVAEEAEALAADLNTVRIPIVAVLGNHDHHHGDPLAVKRILQKAGVAFLDEEGQTIEGVGFAGVKGFGGGFGSRMLASFGEAATKHFVAEAVSEALMLERSLGSLACDRAVVVLHYSPVEETIHGEPEAIFPFIGCSRLAETIDRFAVAAVFHGHAHHGSLTGRTPKGAAVYNCCLDLLRREGKEPPLVIAEV
jgi:uncharacterized protein